MYNLIQWYFARRSAGDIASVSSYYSLFLIILSAVIAHTKEYSISCYHWTRSTASCEWSVHTCLHVLVQVI